VYIIPEREDITFTLLSPIAVAPTILVYGCEMISECQKHCANWSKKHQHMNKMIGVVKTSNNENLTDEQKFNLEKVINKHKRHACCINFGMLPNWVIFSCFCYGFYYLMAQRLDGKSEQSWFTILIPFWILLVYGTAFVILLGLAS
jgi:hypothetical protein